MKFLFQLLNNMFLPQTAQTKGCHLVCLHHLIGLRKGVTQTSHVFREEQTVESPANEG